MPFAQNDQGQTLFWNGTTWEPAKTAVNDQTGETLGFDGQGWTPLATPQAQPAAPADEGPGFWEAVGKRNLDRGVGLIGGLGTTIGQVIDAPADYLERNIPLGTLDFSEGVIPSWRSTTEQELASPNLFSEQFQSGVVKPAKEAIGYEAYTDGREGVLDPFYKGDYSTAISNVPAFAAEQFLGGIPDMAAALTAPWLYGASRTGEIATERAANDGRTAPTWEDTAYAAPAAAASTVLERFGLGGILNPGKSLITGPLKAGGKEAFGEGVEEGAEYGATTINTEKGFDPVTAAEMTALGAVGGGPAGTIASIPFMLRPSQTGTGSNGVSLPGSEAAPSPPVSAPMAPPTTQDTYQPAPWAPRRPPEPPPTQTPYQPAPMAPRKPQAVPVPTEETVPAPVAPAPQETPPPAPAPAPQGNGQKVFTPDNSMSVDTGYEVIDAGQLQAAKGDLQPRDRTRAGSDTQIASMAGNLDPEQLLGSRESDRGAPIIDETNTVLSGNGRVAAIRRAAEANPERYEAYKARLRQEGYNVEGMQTPVLVRRAQGMSPEQKRDFVVKSNKDGKLAMSPSEQAKVDAALIDDVTLANYRADADISSGANAPFVRSVVSRLPATEQAAFVNSDGTLSPAGAKRIQGAVFARAYDSPELTNKIVENEEGTTVRNVLMGVAGKWAQMRQNQAAGSPNVASLDITQNLVAAVGLVDRIRQFGEGVKGSKTDYFFSQQDMLNKIDPLTEKLARLFYNAAGNRVASADDVVAALNQYADSAMRQGNAAGDMFGSAPTAEQIVDGLLQARNRKEAPSTETQLGFGLSKPKPNQVENQGTSKPVQAAEAPPVETKPAEGGGETTAAETKPTEGEGETTAVEPVTKPRKKAADSNALNDIDENTNEDTDEDGDTDEDTDEDGDTDTLDDTIDTRSYNNRASRYEQAWSDMGLDPDEMVNAPAPKQISSLKQAILDKLGIKVDVKGNVTRQGIDQMLDGYRNMQWMAHVLGIPAKGMSIGGRLSLSLVNNIRGARGAYNPGAAQIILPGRSRSFAHEWAHFVDHVLMDSLPLEQMDGSGMPTKGQLSSGKTRAQGMDRDAGPVEEAFVLLMNTLFFDDAKIVAEMQKLEVEAQQTKKDGTPTAKALAAADRLKRIEEAIDRGNLKLSGAFNNFRKGAGKQGGDYYKKPAEMVARAFEAYIGHKMAVQRAGGEIATDEFITKEDRTYIDQSIRDVAELFPQGSDRDKIFMSFDRLFEALVDDGFFGAGQPASKPSNDSITNPNTWGKYVDPNDPAVKAAANQYRAQRTKLQEFFENLGINPANFNPKTASMNAGEAVGRAISAFGMSMGGRMRFFGGKNEALQKIADFFDQGRELGRTVKETYEEEVNAKTRSMLNRITNEIVSKFGSDKLSRDMRAQLRDALLGVPPATGNVDPNVVQAAANIRRILNDKWYEMKNAGMKVGWKAGYLPRMYDEGVIWDNEVEFIKDAAKAYADQFDHEIGTDPAKFTEKDFGKLELGKLPPAIKALLKAKDKAAHYAANKADIDQALAALRTDYSDKAANNWNMRLRIGSPISFETRGPSSDFTKNRELPPSADKILEKYMINDPVDQLSRYVLAANRRLAFVKRFGNDGSKLDALFVRAAQTGANPETIREFRSMIQTITGQDRSAINQKVINGFSWLNAIGTMALMPKAALASVLEPMAAGIRTGDMKTTLIGISALIADVHQGFNAVAGKPLTNDQVKNRRELAEYLGITTSAMFDTIMADRMGSAAETSPRVSNIMSGFYRNSGLVALTNSQRRAQLAGAQYYISKLAEAAQGTDGKAVTAQRELRELGIEDHKAVHQFFTKLNGDLSVDALQKSPVGETVGTAVSRLIDQIIQDPKRVDKPQLASHPVLRLMFGLQSFSYAVTRNLLLPQYRTFMNTKSEQGTSAAARRTAIIAANMAALIIAQGLLSDVIKNIMDPDYEEKKKGRTWLGWLNQGASRSGFYGVADPYINYLTSVKYDASIMQLFLGAQVGFTAGAIDRMMTVFAGKNSPNTNAAERNAFKAFYEGVLIPLAGAALSAVPGGPVAHGVAGFILGAASTKRVKEGVTDVVVGEKDSKR